MIIKLVRVTAAEVRNVYVNSRGAITNIADVILEILVKHGHSMSYDDVDDLLFINFSRERFSSKLNNALLEVLPASDKREYTKEAKAGLSKVHYAFSGEIKGIPRAIKNAYNIKNNPDVPLSMQEALELTVTMDDRTKALIVEACMMMVLNGSLYE
jgi:hypothetical protein